ncbi:probable leucine-rich repeat receptor-like protein kinase At1g68400 [Rhodamnia argentea]|uniref:Probable leucine-rich repeat receptor-like protein kinase At1g68400 n=1 Tax=Rhodamnia argentea TaxID=178133 RepID=A0A8B8Q935_9MYRT|nr:probable leucine-rich repeat receptor-like protein kinase At1g68400 [Rhodamnia argentea]
MSPPLHLKKLISFLLLLHFSSLQASAANPDSEPLLAFKAASDAGDKLANWNSSTDACSWLGVSCLHGRVSRLVLESLDLRGSIQPLTSLSQLRVLSLKRNRFSGRVPDLSNLTALKLIFLSHNGFSGGFPASVLSLSRLYRLDLSFNNFSGDVPAALNGLTHLLTLRLEGNGFSGPISGLELPNLQDFNISRNRLAGKVPKSLSGFPESAFAENSALCGYPLKKCDAAVGDPTRPGSDGAIASPLSPSPKPNTVASSPSSMPVTVTPAAASSGPRRSGAAHIKPAALIAIIVGDVLVLVAISLLLYCYFWRSYVGEKKNSKLLESEKIVYSSSPYPAAAAAAVAAANNPAGYERGRMVFFEGVKRFELEDLLRASAEMLGKGGFGTAYKAVLDDGNVVAVKRLKDASVGGRREFEQHMELLGRLGHPNVVSLRAYYFAREEKLLVYDYMANGSLFWLLHGNRGVGRTPLDWTTRLKLAVGAARGLAFIHNSCKSLKLVHGNVKSTNILIDHAGSARVSDYGLSVFASPAAAAAPRPNGYRAPEVIDGHRGVGKVTQKSDVYSFGVVLLELLTGKCPSVPDHGSGAEYGGAGSGVLDLPRWVQSVVREEWTAEVFDLELMRYKDIEEEMVGLLQIAMACTCASPEQRPRMGHVVRMIEEIRGADEESSSPCHDNLESVSDSPSMSEGTCGTSQ